MRNNEGRAATPRRRAGSFFFTARTTLAAAALLAGTAAQACEFGFDNDHLAFRGTDSGYTGGFALACATDLDAEGATLWRTGVELHTPGRLTAIEPIKGDRPYASLLTVARTRTGVDLERGVAAQRTLAAGLLGHPAVAGLQNRMHRWVGHGARVRGWDNQVSNGGEPTFLYSSLRQRLHSAEAGDGFASRVELQTITGYSVGYRTEAIAGAIARIGARTRPWWTIAPDGAPQGGAGGEPGLYAMGGVTVALVGYNALLQGQFRDSGVRLDASEVAPVVGHAWLRVGLQTRGRIEYAFTVHRETADTRTSLARAAGWGTLSVSASF